MTILQDLYDSEINFSIATFWDGGFEVKLGDEMNGFKAETILPAWALVETWLAEKAVEHYPESVFAMIHRDGLPKAEAERISRAMSEGLDSLKDRLAAPPSR